MTNRLPRFEITPLSEDQGGGCLIAFPDYPGCMADGETPEAAIAEGRDALASYLATLRALDRPIPLAAAGSEQILDEPIAASFQKPRQRLRMSAKVSRRLAARPVARSLTSASTSS